MKARVKETGKEFKVMGVLSNTADGYALNEVDLYCDESDNIVVGVSEDYWTRLEHQYAGMAMQGLVTRGEVLGSSVQEIARDIAEISCEVAHALVDKMKEKEERK